MEDSRALQTDTISIPALRLRALLEPLRADDPEASHALSMLGAWNGAVTAESGPAALFELWWSTHLRSALFTLFAPDEAIRALLAPGDAASILHALESPGPHFGADGHLRRDKLLIESLAEAYRDAVSRLGPNSSNWAWGRMHHAYFAHAVTPIATTSGNRGFDVGSLPMGGSDSTPMTAMYRPSDFRVTLGASVRMVVDVGAWDNSVWINAPGQSGDPRSPHYADLAPIWARGDYVPMLYTKSAVDEVVEQVIILRPAVK